MNPKILVVDDEPDAVELIRFNLKNAGYQVATAADGDEALQQARSVRPNLIVLDLMLPAVSGLEVCKILRRDQQVARTPILMLTAKAGYMERVQGLEAGGDDYMTKPFSPRELVLRVKRLLRLAGQAAAPEPFAKNALPPGTGVSTRQTNFFKDFGNPPQYRRKTGDPRQ